MGSLSGLVVSVRYSRSVMYFDSGHLDLHPSVSQALCEMQMVTLPNHLYGKK